MIRRLAPWLALLGLVAASILLWQARFSAVAHPLNGDAGFEQGLDGWITGGGKNGLRDENGGKVARFARPAGDGEFQSATRWFGSLEELRYLHVEVEAKWSDVIVGGANWAAPQLVLVTKNRQHRTRFTWDHRAYLAHGNRDWHREEAVFEFTPEMSEVGLAFRMLCRQGKMEIRNFRITALNHRPWVPAATVLLLLCWILWLGIRLRGREGLISWWRALPAAAAVVAASWYLVFPGPRMQFRPLIGSFLTGEAVTLQSEPAKADPAPAAPEISAGQAQPTNPPRPRLRVIPGKAGSPKAGPRETAKPSPKPVPPAAKPPPKPTPEPRSQPRITDAIRNLDLKLDLIHIAAFFVLSLAVFLAAGSLFPWRLLSVVALLSEIVPNWHNGWADTGDLLDLASNLGGLALGAGTFTLLARLGRKLFKRGTPDQLSSSTDT